MVAADCMGCFPLLLPPCSHDGALQHGCVHRLLVPTVCIVYHVGALRGVSEVSRLRLPYAFMLMWCWSTSWIQYLFYMPTQHMATLPQACLLLVLYFNLS
jgi:hypothetical protein